MPEGMGAASAPNVPPPPTNAPGAQAPVVPEPLPTAPKANISRWLDWLKSFANQTFPTMTREARTSGEFLARAANAPATAKATYDYVSRILRIDQMSEAQRRLAGATWLEKRMRHYRAELTAAGKDAEAAKVATLVGQPGSPLTTEAVFRDTVNELFPFWETVKQEWRPIADENYRGIMGLEATDPLNVISQIPGMPIHAIAVDPAAPGAVMLGSGRKQGFENLRVSKPGFTKKASLGSEAYDVDIAHMLRSTLDQGIPASRRAEFLRQAISDNMIVAVGAGESRPEGYRYLGLEPNRGLPDLPKDSKYYAREDVMPEIIQGLGIGDRPAQMVASGIAKIGQPLYNIALASPVELATHIANHFTALFRPGMGIPLYNLKDTYRNALDLWRRDPAILDSVRKLAEISASFGHEAKPGLFGEKGDAWLKKYTRIPGTQLRVGDPTARLNQLTAGIIDTMQKAVRLQLGSAYDTLVKSGHFKDTETGKRDFINQALGNYNNRANNVFTQFLKDSGIQSFATAAHTFTIQGAKQATGTAVNAQTTSHAAAMELRAIGIIKLLPFLAAGPVLNYVMWGQSFPNKVPPFAVRTGGDDNDPRTFDPLAFTGVRRGWRMTGQNAVIENAVHGPRVLTSGPRPNHEVLDRAVVDAEMSLMHMVEGPPAQFAHTALTGRDAFGRELSDRREGALGHLGAAIIHANPVASSLMERERPGGRHRTPGERLLRSLGPFNPVK